MYLLVPANSVQASNRDFWREALRRSRMLWSISLTLAPRKPERKYPTAITLVECTYSKNFLLMVDAKSMGGIPVYNQIGRYTGLAERAYP